MRPDPKDRAHPISHRKKLRMKKQMKKEITLLSHLSLKTTSSKALLTSSDLMRALTWQEQPMIKARQIKLRYIFKRKPCCSSEVKKPFLNLKSITLLKQKILMSTDD